MYKYQLCLFNRGKQLLREKIIESDTILDAEQLQNKLDEFMDENDHIKIGWTEILLDGEEI